MERYIGEISVRCSNPRVQTRLARLSGVFLNHMNNTGKGVSSRLARDPSKGVVLLINAVAVLSLSVGLSNPFRLSVEPGLIKELRAYFTEKLDWLDAETVELE
jgi:hypothetical protein